MRLPFSMPIRRFGGQILRIKWTVDIKKGLGKYKKLLEIRNKK